MNYETIAQAPLGDNILASIAATARDVIKAQEEVADAEEALRQAKDRLRILQEDTLPALMSEAGQEKLKTADGYNVAIKEMVRGTPSKENEAEAFKWLRSANQGAIIKTQLEADLGKDAEETAKKIVETLKAMGVNASVKEGVHWQTLAALVRELLGRGEAVPLDTLGVRVWKQAEVKPAKG